MPKASELEVVVKANLSDFDAGMDKAGKKVDELGTKKTTLKVDSDTKTAESGLENVEKKATEATKPRTAKVDADTKAALSALNSLALKASIGITIPVMVGLGSMLKSAADFEKANNQIQAITDATGGEMAKVSALALQLGRDTVFSAGDAAKGILELTKAGLSLDQAMAAIPGTMALAAAAGIDVGRASEIASNSLNMFSLSADQTGRVADILAATANASSVEIGDVADSLAMAGAVAAAAGDRKSVV